MKRMMNRKEILNEAKGGRLFLGRVSSDRKPGAFLIVADTKGKAAEALVINVDYGKHIASFISKVDRLMAIEASKLLHEMGESDSASIIVA